MSNVILTGVPHSDGMSDEMLAEIEALFDSGLREFGAEIFEHNRERLWLYHAITEIKKRRPPGGQRRERIATAALQGLLADGWTEVGPEKTASEALRLADALIAKLDEEKKG